MASLITLDEHPNTMALVLTLEEAAKIAWLTGHVLCADPITGIYDDMLEHDRILAVYETMVCEDQAHESISLRFRSIK